MITVALAGNPNCGKTSLFNALTGLRQHVGNWPGVTVDRKSGYFHHQGQEVQVVDLPGVYSTAVTSVAAIDETIACDYLLANAAHLVVNVIDASNLVRNLYLSLQLLEMGLPVILAVNMMDIVTKHGVTLNLKRLAKLMGCPVVPLVASRGQGIDALKQTIVATARAAKPINFALTLPAVVQSSLDQLAAMMVLEHQPQKKWLALRLLEQDHYALNKVSKALREQASIQQQVIATTLHEEADILIADARYSRANAIVDQVTVLDKTPRQTITQWLDRIVLNRVLGIPIFLVMMYCMFLFAINIGGAFQDFFDLASTTVFVSGLTAVLQHWHCPDGLIAIFANGFGKGINTVVTFAPVIGGMFLFLAFLEDCGYMARAAFVMDRFMQVLGLPGRSFVPMIVGFGCNVPAVMGARTLSNPRDRILTVMMMPFMSCGARLAIFSVFASAFFPTRGAGIIFLLYLLGIVVAVLSGLVLRKTVLQGQSAPLVMELPAYHAPRIGALLRQAWLRLKGFIWRAGKYIVPICVVIGVLNSISLQGRLVVEGDHRSLLSQVGHVVTPIFAPMGIAANNWPATVGLATGVLAKEVVVGTLNSLYNSALPQENKTFNFWGDLKAAALSIPVNLAQLGNALVNPLVASEAPHDMSSSAYGVMAERFGGRAAAFAYLLFVLLYFPCVSTMAAMRREIGARWAYFSMAWSTGLAYALAVICYQLLTIVLHPLSALLWITSMVAMLTITVLMLRWYCSREEYSCRGLPHSTHSGS